MYFPYFCHMDKKIGFYAFVLLALLVLAMAWATRDEHLHGAAHAGYFFYNSLWFTLLWVLAATMSCYYMVVRSLHRRLSVFLLHASFLVILAGALVTRLTGKTGQVHLRENRQTASFIDEWTHYRVDFPFSLSLKSFEIEYYPGTQSPANYLSIVEVEDARTGERFERKISMNNILRYKGYRFYQSSFDEDMQGSLLSVNKDAWGIMLSYAGYFLMFFSMLWILMDKRERFRFLFKKLANKPVLTLCLLFLPAWLNAATPLVTTDSLTINREQATRLGSLWVDYQGRISPVQTLANDFTRKMTGKNRYQSFSGEQFFFGWLLFPDHWQHVPLFELKSKELIRIAGIRGKDASLADFLNSDGSNKLEPYYRQMYGSNKPEGWLKEAVKLNDKFHLIEMLQNGNLLKIFPMNDEHGLVQWYAPNMDIPIQADSMDNAFAAHFFPHYYQALLHDDAPALLTLNAQLSDFQKKASDLAPSIARLRIEQIYNRIQIFSLLFKICLSVGFLALLYMSVAGSVCSASPKMEKIFRYLLWTVFAAATVGLGLRTCIGGRIPLSNSYETMLLLAWFSLLTGLLARRYSFMMVAFSFLLAGFTLLVAHISSMNPQITPLVPVLKSPLLSIHVLAIMLAYGLCGFMALNSLTAFMVCLFGSKKTDKMAFIERTKETSELLMYPATFLMGAGIFIGAIWANQSWGRYWGWDPKEVWALVTFLLMSFTFHDKTLKWFRNPIFYQIFVWIIFLSVLMTYFGVNYILGGKHSYAG